MNCYVCDRHGRVTPAVAICGNCGVALCGGHLEDELLAPRPGGASYSCSHDPVAWARAARGRGDLRKEDEP